MKTKLLMAALMLTTNAFASKGGGGGVAVVCRDKEGKIESAQILDLYDGELIYEKNYDSNLPANAKVEEVLLKLEKYPIFLKTFKDELKKVKEITVFIPAGNRIAPTNDAFPKLEKIGCNFEQLANYTDENKLLISREIHNELDEVNKAALLVHETVYSIFRKTRNAQDSQQSRKLTAELLSKNTDHKVIDEIIMEPISTVNISSILGPLVTVPAGRFTLVSREVTISKSFEMMKTEVTQEMWVKVMGNNPSYFQFQQDCPSTYKVVQSIGMCPNHPVEQITYSKIIEFIKKLNSLEKSNFRLPTEAEWGLANRGSRFRYTEGLVAKYSWYHLNSNYQSHEVGTKQANTLELHDMEGNVSELTEDTYVKYPYGTMDPIIRGYDYHVLRGCSWGDNADFCRTDVRAEVITANKYVGFRLVRALPSSN